MDAAAAEEAAAYAELEDLDPVPGKPLLQLEVLAFFGGKWLLASAAILCAFRPLKAACFSYPAGWHVREAFLLLLCYATGRLQGALCSQGNRSCTVLLTAASLALAAPEVLIVAYFARLQVFVLRAEFIIGVVSLTLVGCRFVCGVVAALQHVARCRDVGFVVVATAIGLAGLIEALVLTGQGAAALTEDTREAAIGAGIAISVLGVALALAAGVTMILDL